MSTSKPARSTLPVGKVHSGKVAGVARHVHTPPRAYVPPVVNPVGSTYASRVRKPTASMHTSVVDQVMGAMLGNLGLETGPKNERSDDVRFPAAKKAAGGPGADYTMSGGVGGHGATPAAISRTMPYIYVSDIEGGDRGLCLAKKLRQKVFPGTTIIMCGDAGDIDANSIPVLEYFVQQAPKEGGTVLLSGNRDYNVARISEVLDAPYDMVMHGAGAGNAETYKRVHGLLIRMFGEAGSLWEKNGCQVLLTAAWHRYTRATMGRMNPKDTWKDIVRSYRAPINDVEKNSRKALDTLIDNFLTVCDKSAEGEQGGFEAAVFTSVQALTACSVKGAVTDMLKAGEEWRQLLETYVKESKIMHFCPAHKALAVHDFFGTDGDKLQQHLKFDTVANFRKAPPGKGRAKGAPPHVPSGESGMAGWEQEVNASHKAIVTEAIKGNDIHARAYMAMLAEDKADGFMHGFRPAHYYQVLERLSASKAMAAEVDHVVCGHQPAPMGRLSRVETDANGYWLAEIDTQMTAFSRAAYLVHDHTFDVGAVPPPTAKGKGYTDSFITSITESGDKEAKKIVACYGAAKREASEESNVIHAKWTLGVVSFLGVPHRVHCFLADGFKGYEMLIALRPVGNEKAAPTTRGDEKSAVMLNTMVVKHVTTFQDSEAKDVHVFSPLVHNDPDVIANYQKLDKTFGDMCGSLDQEQLTPQLLDFGMFVPASVCSVIEGETKFFRLVVGTSTLDPAVGNFTIKLELENAAAMHTADTESASAGMDTGV